MDQWQEKIKAAFLERDFLTLADLVTDAKKDDSISQKEIDDCLFDIVYNLDLPTQRWWTTRIWNVN